MNREDDIRDRVEGCFRTIRDTRMDGVPILNDALEVRLLGLRRGETFWIGTLLTPWFMNILLLPDEAGSDPAGIGNKRIFRFPSGSYEFIRGEEALLGPYWMCSLFSPVFEFEDQETAEACGSAALEALFGDPETPSEAEMEMTSIWQGEIPQGQASPADALNEEDQTDSCEPGTLHLNEKPSGSEQTDPQGLSRRNLLRGNLAGEQVS